jgi:hypothetical protein
MDNRQEHDTALASTLKSRDTEEWIDLIFYRPIGYRWALLFKYLHISPNAVTIASIVLGVCAGICFYPHDIVINLIGMGLLVWANMYDSADGQLARLTGQKSELGRILDGAAGDIWFIAIYAAICLRLTPEWGWTIWLLAALTGACHTKQAAMADYYRNIHLYFLKGKEGSELDNSFDLRHLYQSLSFRKEPLRKLFYLFYTGYTEGQEKYSPGFQVFFVTFKARYKKDGKLPEGVRQKFLDGSRPLMKYTNILSFNTRCLVLFFSIAINVPWLYFLFELSVLNVILIYMLLRHEALSRRLTKKLYR